MSVIAPLLPYAPDRSSHPWRWLAIAIVVLAAAYLAMLNPYWVPSGDGEVYTCIARSLVKGEGLKFNGSRAAIAPPGWPIMLSLAMRISPQFLFLKAVIISCMLGAMAIAFFIVRRYVTSDRAAAGIVVITGTLSSVYPLTYWTHTEAFFCLLGFAAILIAFRIAEGRARLAWELPAMLLLLAMASFTRWPGLLHMVLVIPILLSGTGEPWRRRATMGIVALVVLVCAGTFVATHAYLSLTPQEKAAANESGANAETEGEADASTASQMPNAGETTQAVTIGADNSVPGIGDVATQSKRGPVAEILYRIGSSGKWFAWLLWQPTRFGQSIKLIDISALVFGWLSIALLAVSMVRGIERRDYFWIGLALYTGGLCVLWPNPNARYFVPVAPFIVVGVIRGIRELSLLRRRSATPPTSTSPSTAVDDVDQPLTRPFLVLTVVFVSATLLSNLPLLAIDIRVFRSPDFYGQYEAGANKQLIEVAHFLNESPPGKIAINERYENMGRARYSKFGMRALHLLTDKPIIGIDRKNKYRGRPTDEDVRRWLKKDTVDATYCVYQASWNPWRVWHFRFTPEFQQRLTGKPAGPTTGGWELYARRNAQYPRVDLPPAKFVPPTRVPGL